MKPLAQRDPERMNEHRDLMGGGDPVDVVTPLLLECEHHFGDCFRGDGAALAEV